MSSSPSLSACAVCSKPSCSDGSSLKKCGRCGTVAYCGVDCQRSAWKDHKVACKAAMDSAAAPDDAQLAALKAQLSQYVQIDEGHGGEGDSHGHGGHGGHGHSHGGKPCGGHGPAPPQQHAHSHGGNHGHSHGGVPCGGHGGAPQPQPTPEQMKMLRQYMQQMQAQQQQQQAQAAPSHGHSHAGGHGHSHGGVECHGHGGDSSAPLAAQQIAADLRGSPAGSDFQIFQETRDGQRKIEKISIEEIKGKKIIYWMIPLTQNESIEKNPQNRLKPCEICQLLDFPPAGAGEFSLPPEEAENFKLNHQQPAKMAEIAYEQSKIRSAIGLKESGESFTDEEKATFPDFIMEFHHFSSSEGNLRRPWENQGKLENQTISGIQVLVRSPPALSQGDSSSSSSGELVCRYEFFSCGPLWSVELLKSSINCIIQKHLETKQQKQTNQNHSSPSNDAEQSGKSMKNSRFPYFVQFWTDRAEWAGISSKATDDEEEGENNEQIENEHILLEQQRVHQLFQQLNHFYQFSRLNLSILQPGHQRKFYQKWKATKNEEKQEIQRYWIEQDRGDQ